MGFELSEAARAYLVDRTMRAGILDLLEHDPQKSELFLPWREAREFARARLMAEVARADLVELMFALWEEVWGRHVPRLGRELPYDDGFQDSFMPHQIWDTKLIGRVFEMPNSASFRDAKRLYLTIPIWDEGPSFSIRACFYDRDLELIEARVPDGWRRQPGNDDWLEGAVAAELFDAAAFAADPDASVQKMRQAADIMIAEVIGSHDMKVASLSG